MKRTCFLFLFSMITYSTLAQAALTECGEYTANGVVRALPDGIKLIINEKTLSEYVISMPTLEQMKVAGFIDRDVTVVLLLNKKTIGQKLESAEIRSATLRTPDPLNPKDTSISFKKAEKCIN